MEQVIQIWTGMDLRRRVMVVVATAAMFAAIIALSRAASSPSLTLLYSGLEPASAGEVVAALEQQNIAHQIKGGAIYVDATQRDSLRMTLAAQGLPANSTKGYELLDSLTGFGTTSRMFDAAYWRAKEGELARTIAASPQIASARVHIASPIGDPFRRNQSPTASITVRSAGAGVSNEHARSLTFLVASSVAGLTPDRVTVMDHNGALLGVTAGNEAAGAAAKGQSDDLRAKLIRLIEARVGQGNAVVEVTMDTVTEREEISERIIDPNSLIAISTDTEERSSENSGSSGGGVTVASNLPDGEAAVSGQSREQDSEIRERVNYEFSETHREISRPPGSIRRISIAILVNQIEVLDGEGGSQTASRSDAELTDLKELVVSAAGLDEARGDQITIKSMTFEASDAEGVLATATSFPSASLDVMGLAKSGLLALVVLGLGIFVLKPILTKPQTQQLPQSPPLNGVIEFDDPEGSAPDITPTQTTLPDLAKPDPMERFRELIGERQDESIQILQSWLAEKEKAHDGNRNPA